MASMHVDGTWPGPLTLSNGWATAHVRPWNDEVLDPVVRLERGGAGFVRSVVSELKRLGAEHVYTPALFPGSTRVWTRAGFSDHVRLEVMERAITANDTDDETAVKTHEHPEWETILDIDREAFEGFWRMSEMGLLDAYATTRDSVVMTIGDPHPLGYALLGAQWGTTYLHRIAVRPELTGQGLGTALLAASAAWGRSQGTRSMILNVRGGNTRAKGLYERFGFNYTTTELSVLRKTPDPVLN